MPRFSSIHKLPTHFCKMPSSCFVASLLLLLSTSGFSASSDSSQSTSASFDDLLCPNAKKHTEIDKQIGNRTSLIAGSNSKVLDNAKEVVMLAMAGEKHRHLIVLSIPGILLGGLDFGATDSPSALYVSTDAGKTFEQKLNETEEGKTFYARKDNGLKPSPFDKNKAIVVAYGPAGKRMEQSYLWITEDAGVTWTRHLTQFRLDGDILFHPFIPDMLLARSNYDKFSVHLSLDFGKTWKRLKESVRSFHWGNRDKMIFLAVDETVGIYGSQPNSRLFRSTDLGKTWKEINKNVHSFGLEGKFIYASIDQEGNRDRRVLMVSNNTGDTWKNVQLPVITPDRFYSILDIEQDLIFIHVAEPGNVEYGTLFTSGDEGVIFSESLERHLFTHLAATDFYRVRGMRGVFLTSRVNADSSISTMITYDRGASWKRLPLPQNLPGSCDDAQKCSLHLHMAFSISGFNAATQGPLSIENATGLIIAHGQVGESLKTDDTKVFISSNGGLSWRFTGLDGLFLYQILDFGGLIVAVKMPRLGEKPEVGRIIYFSTDEGRCWHQRNFTDLDIKVKGLRSSPNGHSLVVSIWGVTLKKDGSRDQWVVITIDFETILKTKCTKDDYVDWKPGCLLGEKYVYKRLKPESFCHNDEAIIGDVQVEPLCPCTRADYDCAYGFERKGGKCVRSQHLKNQEDLPTLCMNGKVYSVNNNMYRKIPGDKCDSSHPEAFSPNGVDLTPVSPERSCVSGSKDFLVVDSEKPKTPAQKTALAAIICVSLLLFSICTLFFVRKFVSLRNERGSYRYSSVRASDEDEFEALIPNGPKTRGIGDYVVAADDNDEDFDLDMELERGLADLCAPISASSSSSSQNNAAPPEIPVSASKSPIKAPTPNVRSYSAESDDDLIA